MSEDGHRALWSINRKYTCRGWGEVGENKFVPVGLSVPWATAASSHLPRSSHFSTDGARKTILTEVLTSWAREGPVLSCPSLSCPVLSCPALPSPVLPCPTLSCPVLSCPTLSCPALSCPVLSCPVLSCPALPYPALSCPLFLFFAAVSDCTSTNCLCKWQHFVLRLQTPESSPTKIRSPLAERDTDTSESVKVISQHGKPLSLDTVAIEVSDFRITRSALLLVCRWHLPHFCAMS